MCDDKEYSSGSQAAHFSHHAFKVEEGISQIHRGMGEASVESIMQHADYALELADKGVPLGCKERLSKIALGELILDPTLTMA